MMEFLSICIYCFILSYRKRFKQGCCILQYYYDLQAFEKLYVASMETVTIFCFLEKKCSGQRKARYLFGEIPTTFLNSLLK